MTITTSTKFQYNATKLRTSFHFEEGETDTGSVTESYFQPLKRGLAAIGLLNDRGASIITIITQRVWKSERQYIELNCNEATNHPQHQQQENRLRNRYNI